MTPILMMMMKTRRISRSSEANLNLKHAVDGATATCDLPSTPFYDDVFLNSTHTYSRCGEEEPSLTQLKHLDMIIVITI